MSRIGTKADLYLNGKPVGVVLFQRREDSWAHGEFEPNDTFSEFAELFGTWSLLMHAEDADDRQSNDANDELRQVEAQLDRMKAKLHFPDLGEWLDCAQVNIDGKLIEWKIL